MSPMVTVDAIVGLRLLLLTFLAIEFYELVLVFEDPPDQLVVQQFVPELFFLFAFALRVVPQPIRLPILSEE